MITNSRALQLARDAYSGSTRYFDANVRTRLEQDIRMFQSRHAPDSKYASDAYRARSRLFRPKSRATVSQNEAIAAQAFFSTMSPVAVSAIDEQDPLQLAAAETMQALLTHRLQKSVPWFLTLMGAYQDAQVTGAALAHLDWEYLPERGIDRPSIRLVPLENFRFDPAASWADPIGTSPYLIELIPMYIKDVKRRMRIGTDGAAPKWFPLPESELQSSAQSFDNTRLLRDEGASDARDVKATTEFSVVWVHRNIVEDGGVDWCYYTLGDRFLLSEPVLLAQQYGHPQRPYVLGCCVVETHRPYKPSAVRLTRSLQEEMNELVNQRIDNVKLVLNKRYFVKRNKQVDLRSITRNTPGSVTMMLDPDGDVRVVDTPDVTASSYQEQDRLNLDFDEIAGSFSNSSVQSNRRMNETVGGMQMLTESSNQLANYRLKTFTETFVEPVLRQLVLLEQAWETDQTVLALAGKRARLERFGLDHVTDELLLAEVVLTVDVGMGTTSPTNQINNLLTGVRGVKEALADSILERYGVAPDEIIKEIFGALGYKNGGRFFRETENAQVESLRAQLEKLQQQLEAKHPQAVVDATVEKLLAEVEYIKARKVAEGVSATYSAIQTAESISLAPQVAPIADKVLEAQGYTVPDPRGVDPGLPFNAADAAGVSPAAAEALQTGPVEVPESGNTSPMFPAVADSPRQGIETEQNDG